MNRIVTYDISRNNNYQKWYAFVEKMKGIKITESTFMINSELDQAEFEKALQSLFQTDDNVAYITCNAKEGLFFIKLFGDNNESND